MGAQSHWSREKEKVITTRSHIMFAVRECIERMHRGDHVIFEHPSNASSLSEPCTQKLIAQPSVFRIEGSMCRWHLLSGESGFVRELASWLTNHPDLADALEKWCDSVPGDELDRHMQVINALAAARYLVELVGSFLEEVRADLRGNEELSDVAAFSAGPLAEDALVDDVRGAVLETGRVKHARREEVKWCRVMGAWGPVLRKDMDSQGSKAVLLMRVDQPTGLGWS